MGLNLFGSSRSSTSSTTNTDNSVDYRPIATQSGVVATDGSNVTITDGGAFELAKASVEEGNDTVRLVAQMQADNTFKMGSALIGLADSQDDRATKLIETGLKSQGEFFDKVLGVTAKTQSDAQGVLDKAMSAAAAANTPATELQQRNVLIGLGIAAAALIAVAYWGKR